MARQDILWTALPALIAATLFTFLRRVDIGFSRRDAILLPTFISVLLGLVDMTNLPVDRAAVERHILSASRAAREGAAA